MRTEKTIEEYVLEALKEGPLMIERLIATITKRRRGTSRQGIYRTLRAMRKRQIVTVHAKTVSLSAVWIAQMQDYFAIASHYYSNPINDSSFLNLKEGEKVSYIFQSLLELDIFWSHAIYLFFEVLKNNQPLYAYNPHDWAYFVRKESDAIVIAKSLVDKRQIFLTVGNSTPLDKQAKRDFDGKQEQQYLLKINSGFKKNYYMSVIDDYCIEGFLDQRISNELDSLYEKYETLNSEFLSELKNIIGKRGKHKLTVSRHKKKASTIKGLLNKYFYVKK